VVRDAPAAVEQAVLDELDRRMRRLGAVFDLSRLEGSGRTARGIRRYYERSRVGYRFVHSDEGAMHMALNPGGTFDPAGYEAQALLVHERLAPGTRDVLELACGNGYNLALLAPRNPGMRFVGVDLVASQIRRARAALADLPYADARIGDFQSLAMGDASQDCVYVIESLCHATDLPRALGEIARVLRPGGQLIVVDGWRTGAFARMPRLVRDATITVERAMAVSVGQSLPDWICVANTCRLWVAEERDLTAQIVPNLERLAAIAQRFVSRPRRARLARAIVPESLLMNAVAAYLMPLVVRAGAHTYRLLVLERR
jgi:ubiquinone/menaquinone biosynthesis C-methylase UbiE